MYQHLLDASVASTWQSREAGLTAAFSELAKIHHEDSSLPKVEWHIRPFFGRPFRVIHGDFPAAIGGTIQSPELKGLIDRRIIGGIDQISDNTDLLEDVERIKELRSLFA